MLVLSRRENESICISDDIKVVVIEIRGDKVRLGVIAPNDVPVHRQEVYDAIKRSNPDELPISLAQKVQRSEEKPLDEKG